MGYPHPCPDLGWGTSPVSWMGSPQKVEQTHTCENITSRRTTYAGGKNTVDQTVSKKDTAVVKQYPQMIWNPMKVSNIMKCFDIYCLLTN